MGGVRSRSVRVQRDAEDDWYERALSLLKFCAGALCKAVFVVRPDSDQSSEWRHQFVVLKTGLVGKYGEPIEDSGADDRADGKFRVRSKATPVAPGPRAAIPIVAALA